MISKRIKQRFSKIIAGIVSVAMTMTMVPEIWLPIYAQNVSQNIIGSEIQNVSGDDSEQKEVTTAPDETTEPSVTTVPDETTEPSVTTVPDETTESSVTTAPVDEEPFAVMLMAETTEIDEIKKYNYKNNTYAIIDVGITWSEAKAYCENLGGHLVSISDSDEQNFINTTILPIGTKNMYWAGGYRNNTSDNWQWVTDENFEYSNWSLGEPNSNDEHYIHMYRETGTWNNTYEYSTGSWFYGTINSGFICEWEGEEENPIITDSNYAVFSGSTSQGLNLYGWKSYFTGNIYTGNNFNYSGSELYIKGKVDAVNAVVSNGWITEITEKNEYVTAIPMPDYDEVITANAQPCEYFETSPAYIQDKTVINSSIKVNGDVTISGTTFEGDCYIIAEGNITYNVQDFNTAGRVFLYSRNGNITINGSQISINGAMYAPNGNVTFNTYDTTVTGFICADTITFNGSLFNVSAANFDMVQPKFKGIVKTYTTDADFNEGTLNGVSLAVPDQLVLGEKADGEATAIEKVFGDIENGKGIKIKYSSDKATLSDTDTNIMLGYDLSGFGDADVNENAVDLVLVADESGSMVGDRFVFSKEASKNVVSLMKDNDRSAIVGFSHKVNIYSELTTDKENLYSAIDKINTSGRYTYIYQGINEAVDMLLADSPERSKYIILLSDGEGHNESLTMAAAKKAGENGIRIFAMMIGTETLQMQNIAIHSNGVYKNAPTPEEIGKIMSYFASEVFNVAGRNTTFRTTVKDKNAIDVSAITPAPSAVKENANGSVTLEWNFDRITIDEAESISIPMSVNVTDNFAELTENTSCVYYDRDGKPHIIYADDVTIPVSRYTDSGSWSVIFDSEKEDINWSRIYWNGTRYGDSKITVYASTSMDGVSFGEAMPVNNYEELSGLSGRYVKLDVDMTVSSDGRSPELYDITIMSEEAEAPGYSNTEPSAEVVCKNIVKVNVPVNIRADISDDCLKSDITAEWTCENENVTFTDSTALLTTVSFAETGSFDIVCIVTDGENAISVSKTIVVEPADSYADIDPDKQEAPAPEIEVVLPEYADRKQVINAKIEKLNDTEISWYSVIFNGSTAVNVDDEGNFTLTMPNKDGKFPVVARAFDWSGKSDVKEYTIIVDSTVPTVEVAASADKVSLEDEAYFTVNLTGNQKIKSIVYTLNGEIVNVSEDSVFAVDTSQTGEYIFTAEIISTSNKTYTASAAIIVEEKDTEAPVVEITPDKSEYKENDTVCAEIIASDNTGVTKLEAFVNGEAAVIDENSTITIENVKIGEYKIEVYAYDEAGNYGEALCMIAVADDTAPEVSVIADKEQVEVGDSVTVTVTVSDNSGNVTAKLYVNGTEIELINGQAVYTPDSEGEYVFTAEALDENGNKSEASVTVLTITADHEAPVVTLSFDKDTYIERDDIIISVTAEDNTAVTKTILVIDGVTVELEDGKYTIVSAEKKTYEIYAIAYDEAENMGTASANIIVNEASTPVISIVFDKESYIEGDTLTALITAEGQREIKAITVTVNGEEKTLGEDGMLVIENLAAGDYVFSVTAEDVKGFASKCEKTITVGTVDTEDKRLTASIEPFVEYGETALLTVSITEAVDASTIKAALNGETIQLSDSLTYEFTADELFEHKFVITAKTVDGEIIEKEVSTYVKDSICPSMTITYDKPDGYYEGDDIIATVVAEDNIGIKRVEYTYDGIEYPIDENGQVIIPNIHVDNHVVVANAWDTFGNCITLTGAFIVTYDEVTGETIITDKDEVEDEELICKLYSPKDGQSVTAPLSIVGTAAGTEFKNYKLEYAPAGTSKYTLIKEGTEAVNANLLGKFDTTLLNNGLYNIRLTVYSEKKNITTEVVVSVEGNMKIGNFSMAFQDMDVNVAGLPLTVIRSYDSRSRDTSGDFGYGWDMSTAGLTLSESCSMGNYWSMVQSVGSFNMTQYSVGEKRAHIVTVNYGNGKTDKFRAYVKNPNAFAQPSWGVTLNFKAENGTKSKLEIYGADELIYNNGYLLDENINVYNPTRYRLTTQDGTVYIIHKTNGVESITEPNGSKITFTANGITHSDGKKIAFNRDSENRITSIVSPSGNTVTYSYDENGDLVSVTDVSGGITKFVYDNHYLTEIIDPRGVSVSKNIYDDDGRLIKIIDADGNEITYDHDINGREELVTDRNGGITRYVYDQYGNILSQTDPMGNTITNTYDSNGYLETKTDAMGNVTNYDYSSTGELLTFTDAEGNTVENVYNSKGQITSINAMGISIINLQYNDKGELLSTTDALGNSIDYSYDTNGRLNSVTDEIGSYMNMTYDSNGNVTSAVNAGGTEYQFTYDEDGNYTSQTATYTSDGVVKTVTEQYFYDAAGNLTNIIDSEGNVVCTDYNSMGKVSCSTDEKGRKTTYDYDNFGNLIKISYPDGTSESFTYDREGNNLTATDRIGRTVTMTYDKVGNLLSKTYPNGAKTTYTYDKNYNLVSETSASGGTTSYEYDNIGRNTAITDALGNRTAFAYNSKSQLESMTDPMGRTYTYSYDDNGNRTKTVYPDGSSVSTEYDSRGRITRQVDQNGYSTDYVLDDCDNLIKVTNAQGISTNYTYDELGNMTAITDGNGNVTKYAYDAFGRVIKTTNALGNSAYTTYDESGNVLTSTDYAGNTTTFTYDNYDRILSKTNNDGTVSYAYTADGKISSVTDNSGVTKFTYDSMDGLTRVDYPDGNYVAYSYDNACRLTKVSTAFGDTSYEYDTLDRMTRVIDRNGYATVYEYDANGNRTAVRYANGLTVSYEYDKLNRLICEETIDSDSNVVVKYVYTLGKAGERLSIAETDRTVEYTYDSLYRLTGETITEGEDVTVYTYAYDNVGNRTLKTKNGAETAYSYNELNQLISENDITYEYDLNGNAVRMTSPSKSALYVYNAENRLIRATVQSGNNVSVEEYEYDYAGNRVAKSSEGEYTRYLLDVNGELTYVLAEMNYENEEKCFYTRGTDLISQERDGEKSYYVYDGHGSVRALADEKGRTTDKYDYDAFGNLISSTGRTENGFLFAGEQFDSVTGLYYLRARYMNPSVGTFISMDAYSGSIDDPTSLHKYLYAHANPVSNSDPSGYSTLADMNTSMGIQGVLSNIATPNGKALFDAVMGMFGFAGDVISTIQDGIAQGLSREEIAANVAAGLLTSLTTNFSCMLTKFYPPVGYILMGVAALVVGLVAVVNISNGNTEFGIAQVINLVSIVFHMFNPTCFTGDTEVSTSEGLVCIEEIEVGDEVWAYNSETGETELKEVLNVWVKETDEILHVSTSDGEIIDTTTNHPFYVGEKGWVAAGDLEIGDVLYTADGDEAEVTDLELEKLAEPITVYNLEVEDFHTYFVGEYGVLVHNAYGHEAQYELFDVKGNLKVSGTVKSGADKGVGALSWPEQAKTHTEIKILEKIKAIVESGDVLIIEGSKPPCNPGRSEWPLRGCQGAMQEFASLYDILIYYFVHGDDTPWIFPRGGF